VPAFAAPASAAAGQAPVPLASGFRDFDVVAYQGEDVLGGHEVKFSSIFRNGRPVILNYWAGLCPPCRAEMPGFQRVADANAAKVIFFGLDVGPFVQLGTHEDAVELYNALRIHYPLGYATSVQPLRLYSVQGMPTTAFFSASGRVVDKVSGVVSEGQLQAEIQKLVTAE
jgi:thiol-disulfide isomerase/thioredoxin